MTKTPKKKRGNGSTAGTGAPSPQGGPRLVSGNGIVPREGVAGQSFAAVIAIMAFLASIAVGAVAIVAGTANSWRADVAREVTIQIRPFEKAGMENAVREASRVVLGFEGIERVTALDEAASARLLEPWLGAGLDLTGLPVPRLLTVSVKAGVKPDLDAIRRALAEKVPGATLDDHRAWLDRLTRMAFAMVAFTISILALVLCATALTVVFATRGAMAGNCEIIDVLHFAGAQPRFIAHQFQRHFLALGIRGAAAGGLLAAALIAGLGLATAGTSETPEATQIAALFGRFSPGITGYLGIVAVIGVIALIAAVTSRRTVLFYVASLEVYGTKR